jgi:predicted transcriptional regulator
MKTLGITFLLIGVVGIIVIIVQGVKVDYRYNKQIGSYWSLADKASTIDAKKEMIDKYVFAIEEAHLGGYNAIYLKTPDNSYEENMKALKTLQSRLTEIKGMNPNSFEYQTALQQITGQEMGEADKMLNVFEGIWYLNNYGYLWGWIGGVIFLLFLGLVIVGGVFWILND